VSGSKKDIGEFHKDRFPSTADSSATMGTSEFIQRFWRRLELRLPDPLSILRRIIWQIRGLQIGPGTHLPKCAVTWPHQVRIGAHCVLQPEIFFNVDHYWVPGPIITVGDRVFIGRGVELNCREGIRVDDDAMIAAGCRLIDCDHGTAAGGLIRDQPIISAGIVVGRGAWLGANVVVLKGVHIGEGAVIGAGSVVTKSVPAGEIWVGVPARFLRSR
jgi:acetyltransferase-like isoleucine patch superfamily enzyme